MLRMSTAHLKQVLMCLHATLLNHLEKQQECDMEQLWEICCKDHY